jgi:hypothetical protein
MLSFFSHSTEPKVNTVILKSCQKLLKNIRILSILQETCSEFSSEYGLESASNQLSHHPDPFLSLVVALKFGLIGLFAPFQPQSQLCHTEPVLCCH